MTRIYTKKRIEFLRTAYMTMRISDLTVAFNNRYKLNQTETAIRSALKNNKIRCGRETGKMKGVYRLLTPDQVEFIKANYQLLIQIELTEAFNIAFNDEKTVQQIRSFTRNHRIRSGRTGYFDKGHESWNKGTKGLTHRNRTSFKKGDIPKNTKPLGAERVDNKDGYIHVKIAEPDPYTKATTRYKQKHVVIWEKKHGPVPKGMAVIFKDGKRLNCDISNLILVSRAELLNLNQNHYREIPEELKAGQLALSKLETKIFSISKNMQSVAP